MYPNDSIIEIDFNVDQLHCNLDIEVQNWLDDKIFMCFQNYVSVFKTLPYPKHNFFISFYDEETLIDCISITITNYTTFNDNEKIYVNLITDEWNGFNDLVKIYFNKENIDKKSNNK